jgi:hypothetical protein
MRDARRDEQHLSRASTRRSLEIYDTHLPSILLRLTSIHADNQLGNNTYGQGDNQRDNYSFIHDLLLALVQKRRALQSRFDRRITAVTHTPSKRTALTNIEQRLIS